MSLTESRLTESGGMRGLEAGSNRVTQDYSSGEAEPPPPPTVGVVRENFSDAQASHGSLAVTKPADLVGAANQGVLVHVLIATFSGTDPSLSAPAGKGFTALGATRQDTHLIPTYGLYLYQRMFWSEADLSADSSFTFTFTNGFISRIAAVTVNDTTGPIGDTVWASNGSSAGLSPGTTLALPSITTTEENSLAFTLGLCDGTGSLTTPSGYTAAAASDVAYIYEWWQVMPSPGATPTPTTSTVGTTTTQMTGTVAFAPAPVTAPTAPNPPVSLNAVSHDGYVQLSWTPGSSNGSPITDYVVEYRTTAGPGSWNTFTDAVSATPSVAVTGLTNDTSYDFQVSAVNAIGTSTPSSTATATPTATPPPMFLTTFTAANGTALTALSNLGTSGGAAFVNQSVSAGVAPPGSTIEVQSNKGVIRPPNVHLETPYLYSRTVPGNGTFYYNLTLTNVAAGGYIVTNYRQGTDDTTVEWWVHDTLFAVVGNVGNHGLTFVDGDIVHCLIHANGTAHEAFLWKNAAAMPASPQVTGTGGSATPANGAIQFQMKRGPTAQVGFLLDDLTVYADPTLRYPF